MTLVEAQNEFLKWLDARGVARHTIIQRRHAVRRLVAFLKAHFIHDVEAITRGVMGDYQRNVMEGAHYSNGKPLVLSTRITYLINVKLFLKFLVERRLLIFDPSAALIIPKPKRGLPKNIPTEEEMEAIVFRPDIGTPMGMRDRALLELLYSTGMRRAEAAGLDLYDVNLAESTVTIRHGKGGKGRTVPLGSRAVHFLTRYMNEARRKLLISSAFRWGPRRKSKTTPPNPLALFVVPGGYRIRTEGLGKVVGGYVHAVNPGVTLSCHAIRHAFATHMLRGGANLPMIQRILGHAKIKTTEIYTQVTIVDLKEEHKKCHPRGVIRAPKKGSVVEAK